jgi:hypothetical protein
MWLYTQPDALAVISSMLITVRNMIHFLLFSGVVPQECKKSTMTKSYGILSQAGQVAPQIEYTCTLCGGIKIMRQLSLGPTFIYEFCREYHTNWIFCKYDHVILEFGNHYIYQELSTFE